MGSNLVWDHKESTQSACSLKNTGGYNLMLFKMLCPPPVPSLPKRFHLIVLPWIIDVSLLWFSFLLSFSGAVNCSLVILCFTSNIHLEVSTYFVFLILSYLTQDFFSSSFHFPANVMMSLFFFFFYS